MPTKTTKTAAKSGAKKKPKKQSLSSRVNDLERLLEEYRANVVTSARNNGARQEEQDKRLTSLEQAAKPTDPPPAEQPIAVGDWVYGKHADCVIKASSVDGGRIRSAEGHNWVMDVNVRRATPAEIAEHKRKEEARLKSEAEAKELAMPLEFGTRVKWGDSMDRDGRIVSEAPNPRGHHLVAYMHMDTTCSILLLRSEFKVLIP